MTKKSNENEITIKNLREELEKLTKLQEQQKQVDLEQKIYRNLISILI